MLDKLVIFKKNVLNDLIVSHKLGHCNLFSYRFVLHVLYNNHDQFYIFLLFAVPKISILLKIRVFSMFSKLKYFFVFYIERNQALAISFFLIT